MHIFAYDLSVSFVTNSTQSTFQLLVFRVPIEWTVYLLHYLYYKDRLSPHLVG